MAAAGRCEEQATFTTSTFSWALVSVSPSESMTLQKGLQTAIRSAPVARASSVRVLSLMRAGAELFLQSTCERPGATAEGLLARSRHLAELDTRQDADELMRRGVDALMAAEVAGIVGWVAERGHNSPTSKQGQAVESGRGRPHLR